MINFLPLVYEAITFSAEIWNNCQNKDLIYYCQIFLKDIIQITCKPTNYTGEFKPTHFSEKNRTFQNHVISMSGQELEIV